MSKQSIIVVGGGISGLYLGYKLLDKYNVSIIEKSNRLGGRIHTKEYKGIHFESGAGRFSKCHKYLYKLLNEFAFKNKMIPIKKNADIKVFDKKINELDINYYYEKIFENYKKIKKNTQYLSSISTYDYLKNKLNRKEFEDFLTIYPFIGDIKYSNALCGLNILACEYNTKQFFVLKDGLEQFVEKMKDLFIYNGGNIKLNTEIVDLLRDNDNLNYVLIDKNNNQYICNKVVLSMTPSNLLKLNPDEKYFNFLKYINKISLLRIYFYYDIPQKNLKGLNKTITDLDIHFVLPINEQIIHISYTDSHLADMWYNLYYLDTELFYKKILSEFKKLYNVNLDIPNKVFLEYWEDGMFVWKPGFNYIKNKEEVMNPIPNLYLCNEGFSDKQGWIEGSLRLANDLLEIL